MSNPQAIADALSRIPFLNGVDPSSAVRLGGLTNLNYLVVSESGKYVLRLPGLGTAEYIDRNMEALAARSASDAGVNAELVFFDPISGLMATRFVDNAITMSPAAFRASDVAIRQAGDAMRRLHTTAVPFGIDFDIRVTIAEYEAMLTSKGFDLPVQFAEFRAGSMSALAVLEAHPVELCPSHCDPLCENFLATGDQMFLIDYEYSGNNDPLFDLGDFSVEAGLSVEQDLTLLAAYFGAAPTASNIGRMVVHKVLCDHWWSLWGLLQHVNNNPVEDFLAYGLGRYERGMDLLRSPDFVQHVNAISTADQRPE